MKEDREPFKVTANVRAYKDQDPDYAPDPITITAGEVIWAAVADQQKRKLNDKLISVVRFTRGLDWCWMPRREFGVAATKTDIRTLTSIPFQR